jgi:hypothetical protein
VGIGTTNPTATLDVVGNVKASGDVSANYFYGDGSNLTGITSSSADPNPTFTTVTDSSPVSCSKNSPSIMIQVVDEILKANTNNDQTICYNTIPVDISATGFTPVAPAPNIGDITYQWYGSTDNAAFTALGAGYNGVATNILDPQTALTQTNYYKLTTTNTYPIYPVQR